jgi:hypothetical protein
MGIVVCPQVNYEFGKLSYLKLMELGVDADLETYQGMAHSVRDVLSAS